MRDIAAEAGFANGAIKPYFQSKNDLLLATYFHIYESTNSRVRCRVTGQSGLAALEGFAREVLPVNSELHDEAVVFLAFLGELAHTPDHLPGSRESMEGWRTWIQQWLAEAKDAAEIGRLVDVEAEANVFLTLLIGAQPLRVLDGDHFTFETMSTLLQRHLQLLRATA